MNQRASGTLKKDSAVEVSGPQLGNLTDSTRHRILMALATALSVVNGAQAVGNVFAFVEDCLVRFELTLRNKSIRPIVETGWSFGRRLRLGVKRGLVQRPALACTDERFR